MGGVDLHCEGGDGSGDLDRVYHVYQLVLPSHSHASGSFQYLANGDSVDGAHFNALRFDGLYPKQRNHSGGSHRRKN